MKAYFERAARFLALLLAAIPLSGAARAQEGGAAPGFVPVFIRGDANADGRINLTDAVRILSHLFLDDPAEPGCPTP